MLWLVHESWDRLFSVSLKYLEIKFLVWLKELSITCDVVRRLYTWGTTTFTHYQIDLLNLNKPFPRLFKYLKFFQGSLTKKPAEGRLLRRASWFSGKSCAVFRGQVLAVYLIQTVSKFEFKADLFLDLLPPKSVPTTWMSIHELSGSPPRSQG